MGIVMSAEAMANAARLAEIANVGIMGASIITGFASNITNAVLKAEVQDLEKQLQDI